MCVGNGKFVAYKVVSFVLYEQSRFQENQHIGYDDIKQ